MRKGAYGLFKLLNISYKNNNDNKFEEVKKYKDLLDSGIIPQEEFDKKKKELLGLYSAIRKILLLFYE